MQGVTLHLKETGSTSLQITSDTSSIADSVKGLVTAFQDAIQEVTTKTAYDNQTGTFGLLAQSSALQGVSGELSQLLGSRINTEAPSPACTISGWSSAAMAALP